MKKNPVMKWVTIIILIIAAVSLIFGSFIMLLGAGDKDQAAAPSKTPVNTEVE